MNLIALVAKAGFTVAKSVWEIGDTLIRICFGKCHGCTLFMSRDVPAVSMTDASPVWLELCFVHSLSFVNQIARLLFEI